jgi:hypothetical protein
MPPVKKAQSSMLKLVESADSQLSCFEISALSNEHSSVNI